MIYFKLVMIYSWWKYTDIPGEEFPNWADALGWMMTLTVIVAIFGGAIVTIGSAEGDFRQVCALFSLCFVNIHAYRNKSAIMDDPYQPILKYEPRCEKTGLRDFRPGPTQTGM